MSRKRPPSFNKQNENQMRLSQVAKERSDWIKYDARMCLFPELSQDDVRNLCFGIKITATFLL